MKKLVFRANYIATSDYGYIHFSTSEKKLSKEDKVLMFQKRGSGANIIVDEFNIATTLNSDDFTLRVGCRYLFLSNLTGNNPNIPYRSIMVLFEADDKKLSEIKDRLNEACSY